MKPKVHEVKVSSVFFRDVSDDVKSFEARFDDRDYKVGDVMILEEYSNCKYTGRETHKVITYKLDVGQYGIEKDWCVLGLRSMNDKDYKIMEE
jgi:hypothetical protein